MEEKNIIPEPFDNKQHPFAIPEDYFEQNYLKLYEKIFSSGGSEKIWDVPEDYFSDTTLKVLKRSYGQHPDAFLTPPEYFSRNSEKIIQTLVREKKKSVRVIPLILRRVAVAACVAGIAGIFYVKLKHNTVANKNDAHTPCYTLACLTKKDILEHPAVLDDEIMDELEMSADADSDLSNPKKTNADSVHGGSNHDL